MLYTRDQPCRAYCWGSARCCPGHASLCIFCVVVNWQLPADARGVRLQPADEALWQDGVASVLLGRILNGTRGLWRSKLERNSYTMRCVERVRFWDCNSIAMCSTRPGLRAVPRLRRHLWPASRSGPHPTPCRTRRSAREELFPCLPSSLSLPVPREHTAAAPTCVCARSGRHAALPPACGALHPRHSAAAAVRPWPTGTAGTTVAPPPAAPSSHPSPVNSTVKRANSRGGSSDGVHGAVGALPLGPAAPWGNPAQPAGAQLVSAGARSRRDGVGVEDGQLARARGRCGSGGMGQASRGSFGDGCVERGKWNCRGVERRQRGMGVIW